MRRRLPGFGEKGGEGIVEAALDSGNRRLLVDDAGGERFIGFGEGLQGCEHIGIGSGGFAGAEFRDGEGHGGKKLRMQAHEIRVEADIEQWSVRGNRARMLSS